MNHSAKPLHIGIPVKMTDIEMVFYIDGQLMAAALLGSIPVAIIALSFE